MMPAIHTVLNPPIHLDRLFTNDMITALAKMLTDIGIQTDADFQPQASMKSTAPRAGPTLCWPRLLLTPDNINSTFNIYFPTTNIMMPSVNKPDGFSNVVNASLITPQVDSAKLQAVFKLMNDTQMVIPFAEQVQAQFYNKGVNDPGADDYNFVNFQCKEAWLDASARK